MESSSVKPFNLESFYYENGRWKLLEKKYPTKHVCVARYCQRDRREGKRFCHKCASSPSGISPGRCGTVQGRG